ncbi:MAG: AEC family transporter [Turicibacter sp.]|nr:AEC family transporter [Turicibacter sp.]
MENLILSFNVVVPLFLMLVLGYSLKQIRVYDEHTISGMNQLVFKVFLPLLLFINIYQTDVAGVFDLKLMLVAVLGVLGSFFMTWLIIAWIEKDNRKRGVLIQGIFRSNFVIFGIPVTTSLFGGEATGAAALLVAVIVPIFNMLSVVILEIYRGSRINVPKILKGILTNPLIIGSVIGLLCLWLHIKIPLVLEKTISDLSKVTTPLALVILGGSFTFSSMKGNVKQIAIGVLGKLVIVPVICLSFALLIGIRGVGLAILMSIFASPTAVSSFSMAKQMDGDADLAGHLVVLGSMLSVVTMFVWIFIFKQGGFM